MQYYVLKFDVSILSQLLSSEIINRVPECHRNISCDRSLLFILMLLYIFVIFISHEYSSYGKLDNIYFHNILYVTVQSPSHSLAQPEDFLMRAENRWLIVGFNKPTLYSTDIYWCICVHKAMHYLMSPFLKMCSARGCQGFRERKMRNGGRVLLAVQKLYLRV